ncbi:hypothetical protein ACHQM5_020437 [Ranunculus cassubicifolius]
MAAASPFLDLTTCPSSSSFSTRHHQQHVNNIRFGSSNVFKSISSMVFPKPRTQLDRFKLFSSIELEQQLETTDDEMSEGFFQAIEELERMVREPSDVLEEMNNKLSPRELQLVLLYFSQEGKDSWCALEVFEWLHKENKVDKETMELMISIMCSWVTKIIQSQHTVSDVVDLLVDMDCVGLKPNFSIIEKVISLYWEMGNKATAILFVKELLTRQILFTVDHARENNNKRGPVGYLAWMMMADGNYMGAVKMVKEFTESGLKPELYSYLIAMTAVVKELNEISKALRKLKGYIKAGLVAELDAEDVWLIEKYQSDVVSDGEWLSKLVDDDNATAAVHERLLAMYICAGRGLEAEQQLWEMKLIGKEADRELYDIVLAICASQNETKAVARLLAASSVRRKKTLLWLLRGYVKGGHFQDASRTVMEMLDLGFCPEYLDRAAVLQGLRKALQESGNVEPYLKLCKCLSDANLIGPCLVYMYIDRYQLWVIKMV